MGKPHDTLPTTMNTGFCRVGLGTEVAPSSIKRGCVDPLHLLKRYQEIQLDIMTLFSDTEPFFVPVKELIQKGDPEVP